MRAGKLIPDSPTLASQQPFWCGITIAACFDTPAASSKLYVHEAWYIITISLLSSSMSNPPRMPGLTVPTEPRTALEEEASIAVSEQLAAANLGPDEEVESPVDNDRGPFDDMLEPQPKASLLSEAVAYNIDYALICMSR